jgi:hypothetical protein
VREILLLNKIIVGGNKMALTEKGLNALGHVKTYFPTGAFSAADLSSACGEKVFAATLNAIVSNGYLNKLGGSPVMYEAIPNLIELLDNMDLTSKNGCNNSNLHTAKKAKNDEFYTRYDDIEAEVMKYRKYFKDKVVYLPCDDPAEKKSEFWSFFVNNFDAFGIKKLIATHYDENGKTYKIWIDRDNSGDGYIDDADALQEELIGNGDFRSPECVEILQECDIVCTNPPFSLFREFVSLIMTHQKKFLIIGNQNAFTYKEIFSLIKTNQIWTGYNMVKKFYQPDGSIKEFGNVCWFTNMQTSKRIEELVCTKSFSTTNYAEYDNYEAIEVSRVANIPKDYSGVMGVPITFIDKYNPEQFEILSCSAFSDPEFFGCGALYVNGRKTYARVLVKRI